MQDLVTLLKMNMTVEFKQDYTAMNTVKIQWQILAIGIILFFVNATAALASSGNAIFETGIQKATLTHSNINHIHPINEKGSIKLNQKAQSDLSFPDLSSQMLQDVIDDKPIGKYLKILKNVNPDTLDAALDTQRKRLTFWINIYNAYTQYFLKKDPSLYNKDRSAYFSKDQIHIGGYVASFNDIEHGILRRGATIWSKGFFRILAFRSNFIQEYALDKVDFRIHFALNCGAKSCPPIVVYRQKYLYRQLDDNTEYYLKKEVEYDPKANTVKLPAFMTWFSADFGDRDKKREILKRYDVIPESADPSISYLPYDWTPKIDNYKSYSYK